MVTGVNATQEVVSRIGSEGELPKGQKPAGSENLSQLQAIANAMFRAEKVAESTTVTEDEKLDAHERNAFETLKGMYTTNQANFDVILDTYLEAKIQQNQALASKKEDFARMFKERFQALVEDSEEMMEYRLQDLKGRFVFLKEQVNDHISQTTVERSSMLPTEVPADALNARENDRLTIINANVESAKTDWISRFDLSTAALLGVGSLLTVSAAASMSEQSVPLAAGAMLMFNGAKNQLSSKPVLDTQTEEGKKQLESLANKFGVEKEFVASFASEKSLKSYRFYFGKEEVSELDGVQSTKQMKEYNRSFRDAIGYDNFQNALQKAINTHGCWNEHVSPEAKRQWIQTFLECSGGSGSLDFIAQMNGEYRTKFDSMGMWDMFYGIIDHMNDQKVWSEKRANAYGGLGGMVDKKYGSSWDQLFHNLTSFSFLDPKYEKPKTAAE